MTRATVIVDPQRDFVDGSLPVPGAREALRQMRILVDEATAAGELLVVTADWHPAQTPHFDDWPAHCVAGTRGAEFAIEVPRTAVVMRKGTDGTAAYSGAEATTSDGASLEEMLEHADEVIVAGLATDYCVRATVLDLLEMGHRVLLSTNCIAAVTEKGGRAALREMRAAGAVA